MILYTLVHFAINATITENLPAIESSLIFKTSDLCEYALNERKKDIDKRQPYITKFIIDKKDNKRILASKLKNSEWITYMKCVESKINFNKEGLWTNKEELIKK